MAQKKSIGLIDNLQYIDIRDFRNAYTHATTQDYFRSVGGNSGNIAFVHGTRRCIAADITRITWGSNSEWVRRNVSHILVCCANQIGSHVDLGTWADALDRLELPVTLVGLGAQTTNYEIDVDVPTGTKRFLETVARLRSGSSTNVGVRGDFTKGLLDHLGVASAPIGCPSLFISSRPRLGRDISEVHPAATKGRIAIAGGNPFHASNCRVESKLIELCTMGQGAYIAQHPAALIALALGSPDIAEDQLAVVSERLGFAAPAACKQWFARYAYIFHDTDVWMYFLRHFDAIIGARYHGVALGVQAGIPGITIHIDNRTKELSDTTKIPAVSIEHAASLSSPELADLCTWPSDAGDDFDQNRRSMAERMVEFLELNGLPPSQHLTMLGEHRL